MIHKSNVSWCHIFSFLFQCHHYCHYCQRIILEKRWSNPEQSWSGLQSKEMGDKRWKGQKMRDSSNLLPKSRRNGTYKIIRFTEATKQPPSLEDLKGKYLWHTGNTKIVNLFFFPHSVPILLSDLKISSKSTLSVLADDADWQKCILVFFWGRQEGVSAELRWCWQRLECVLEDGET